MLVIAFGGLCIDSLPEVDDADDDDSWVVVVDVGGGGVDTVNVFRSATFDVCVVVAGLDGVAALTTG